MVTEVSPTDAQSGATRPPHCDGAVGGCSGTLITPLFSAKTTPGSLKLGDFHARGSGPHGQKVHVNALNQRNDGSSVIGAQRERVNAGLEFYE